VKKSFIIAIDGPAGSGKSTVARRLAKRLKFTYIDTGAMYRAVTLKALEERCNFKSRSSLIKVAQAAKIILRPKPDGTLKVFLDGKDVSRAIRSIRVTNSISELAKIPGVRKCMVRLQRKMGKGKRVVLEGRDIGTVVFPRAEGKFYLDATARERAIRRHKELKAKDIRVSLKAIEKDIRVRDKKDKTRKAGPLKIAKDAVVIDTTNLSVNEVVKAIEWYI